MEQQNPALVHITYTVMTKNNCELCFKLISMQKHASQIVIHLLIMQNSIIISLSSNIYTQSDSKALFINALGLYVNLDTDCLGRDYSFRYM